MALHMGGTRAYRQRLHRDNKEPLLLRREEEEYKRVKYSLKMALRLVNGSFDDMTIE